MLMKLKLDKRLRSGRLLLAVIALLSLSYPISGLAEEFTVRDMRVEGLQRISEGTVFNYLPINVGDKIDEIRIQEAVRCPIGRSCWVSRSASSQFCY